MADNLTVKDGVSVSKTLRFIDDGSGILIPAHVLVDSTGAALVGVKTKALSLPISWASDETLVGRSILNASASITRPADTTAYASGDLVANSTTAGSVVALSFTATRIATGAGVIRRGRLTKSTTTLTNAVFKLHLYATTAPTVANGDNSAWSSDGVANYLGALQCTMDRAFTDGAYGDLLPFNAEALRFKLASGSTLKGLIEARGAYAPGNAEVFTPTLEIETT